MKLALVLFALLGSSLAAPARTLQEDFEDFASLIPTAEIAEIARRYLATDPEFRGAIAYLKSREFAELAEQVESKEAVQEFRRYLVEAGIDVDAILDYIKDVLEGTETAYRSGGRSLKGFFEEVERALPVGKLMKMFMDKMKNSPSFQDFFKKVSSEEAHGLVEEVRALPEVRRLDERLTEMGFDVEGTWKIIYAIFGWK